jgi:hypothetical protein
MKLAGCCTMSEPKPDPLRRLNISGSSAKPNDGPDQEALAIIERAAREMATRRPRTPVSAPVPAPAPTPAPTPAAKEYLVEPVRSEPIQEPAQETTQENYQMTAPDDFQLTAQDNSRATTQENYQDAARDLVKEFDEEIAKHAIAPLELAQHKEEPIEDIAPLVEVKPAEEIKPSIVLHPIEEPQEETAPFDTGGFFATDEESKPVSIHAPDVAREPLAKNEPAAEVEPVALLEAAVAPPTFPPAANFGPSAAVAPPQFKVAPPIARPEQPRFAPTPNPSAARPLYDDHFHLALTTVQSAALAVAIFAFVLAAFGMAARGWVVAHDWSCRVGMATNACPPPPPPKSLGRAEIPS